MTRVHDVVFVGGGFRTTTFLAAAPDLLAHDVAVVQDADALGPGSYAEYLIRSTSAGERFFYFIDRDGPFAFALDDPVIAAVASSCEPVELASLAAALARLGELIAAKLRPGSLTLGRRATSIEASTSGSPRFVVRLDDGGEIHARACALGTGRRERLAPELAPWASKVWFSGDVISSHAQVALAEALRAAAGGTVVVTGGSHSAFSALGVLLQCLERLRLADASYVAPNVTLAHRRAVRLHYPNVETARRGLAASDDPPFDPVRHICRATGAVFRDTGLRHDARQLFCSVRDGYLPGVALARVPSLAAIADALDDAALIVQALGYRGRAPRLSVDGEPVWDVGSSSPLETAADGRVELADARSPALDLFAIRVEPTPRAARDNANYGGDLYPLLRASLLEAVRSHAGSARLAVRESAG